MKGKIAIIGSSTGQRPLYETARELGLTTIGFAWEKGAICRDITDVFYPISITNIEEIVEVCKKEMVLGVVANASTKTIESAYEVAERLGMICTPVSIVRQIKDKAWVRNMTNNIEGLCSVKCQIYENSWEVHYPCVIKPITGGSKKGVSFVKNEVDLKNAVDYVRGYYDCPIIVEEFISGREVSVECISYLGKHYVVQITDKDSSGAPHFVELGHHEPACLQENVVLKIKAILPQILDAIGFTNGATHTELKIDENDNIYLIEVNPRGGGDEISTKLVKLSTGYDYVKAMIDVAIGAFIEPKVDMAHAHSGIYFLTKQTEHLLPFFKMASQQKWFVEGEIYSDNLQECVGNGEKNGYLIYKSDHKVLPNE